jgi:cysteine-rich repeat protein
MAALLLSCQRPTGVSEVGADGGPVDAPPAACGNNHIDPGEVCDDGNNVSGDGCSADCKSDETCGNGIVDTAVGERCDDGNTIGGDGCSADCKSDETCGNGVVDTDKGETCDDGNTMGGDTCSANCQSNESCGNGIVDTDKGEQCDGGGVFTKTCNINCTTSKCGDGVINPVAGEACDDKNTSDNDSCTHLCTVSRCGDDILDTQTEECDDGNANNSDGCQNTCKLGPGNDTAGFAIDISAGGTFTVDLTHAHDDVAASCSNAGGRDAFYTVTLAKAEVVYADSFGSTFDTTLSIFKGTCAARVSQVLCNDDACSSNASQMFGLLGSGSYCLVVDQGGSGAAGVATLTVRHGGRTGDPIAYGDEQLVSGDTSLDTDVMNADGSCATTAGSPDHGYYFTTCPGQTAQIAADTCQDPDDDTVVYVRSALAIGSDQACNDDADDLGSGSTGSGETFGACHIASYIDTSVGGGSADLHWVVVDGFSGMGSDGTPYTTAGPYTLTYSLD